MEKSYIYLLECVSDWETTYKIGYTKNKDIKKRIKGLQTGNKDTIKCIDLFETKYNRKIEIALHNRYAHRKKGGEWFDLDISDVAKFQENCKKIEEALDVLSENNNYYFKRL